MEVEILLRNALIFFFFKFILTLSSKKLNKLSTYPQQLAGRAHFVKESNTKSQGDKSKTRLKLLTIYIVNQSILRLKSQGSRRWGRSTPTWLEGLILSKSPSGKSGILPRKRVASLIPSGPGSTRSKRG